MHRALTGRRRDLLTIVLMGLGGGLLGLLIPILTGQAFGNVIPGSGTGALAGLRGTVAMEHERYTLEYDTR